MRNVFLKRLLVLFLVNFGLLINSQVHAQFQCIEVAQSACLNECHPVNYIGSGTTNASYSWTIDCGTITNPNLRNPHEACFTSAGLCTIQVIWKEPGQAPETCSVNVEVFPLPQALLSLTKDTICEGECTNLNVALNGTPPFSFQIRENNQITSHNSNSNNYSYRVCPTVKTTYNVVNITDRNCTNIPQPAPVHLAVLPSFTGSVNQINNALCASPDNLMYAWYACNSPLVLSTQQCFYPPSDGCFCVAINNGQCKDTICVNFKCDLTCSFDFPDTICVGDTALIYYTGNGGPNTIFNWILNIDNSIGQRFFGVDSLWIKYSKPGCYPINLTVVEGSCISSCSDTICVINKPCACDSFVKNEIRPIGGGSPIGCCYEVLGDISSLDCFNSVQVSLSAGTFYNVQANTGQGWTVNQNNFKYITYSHNGGFIPPGNFDAGSFCVSGASSYTVSVFYFYTRNGFQDTCEFHYVFDCQQAPYVKKCDSTFHTYLEKQHSLPEFCCFNIHTDNPVPNCFTKMQVKLNTGIFTNVQANNLQGFNLTSAGSQDFTITHISGFIPVGKSLPAWFCVEGAFNPITVTVLYFYTSPKGTDTCMYHFTFDCPGQNPPPDCCDSTTVQLITQGAAVDCCFDLLANSKLSKCFSKICVSVNSGSIVNVAPNPGWLASSTPQGICFLPQANFVPSGPINPGSFCVRDALNPFTIKVEFYDNSGSVLPKCTKQFVRDCPPPPPPCNCDSLKNFVVPVSTVPGKCCYKIQANVAPGNCFSKILITVDAGTFSNVQANAGWNFFTNSNQSFSLIPNAGFIPAGFITPGSFCVNGAANYTVTVHYLYTNNGNADTCSYNYILDCPKLPSLCNCDSLQTNIQQNSVNPGLCCYGLSAKIPTSNCFTKIELYLSSGNFTNIQAANGYTANSNSPQKITLLPNGGFLPPGTILPLDFCVTGSTLYSIQLVYYYNNNGALDTCSRNFAFDCPKVPDPCKCDSLKNFVNQSSVMPGLCCYDIEGHVPYASCFTQMQVQLNSGSFANIQAGTGWSVANATNTSFNINPNTAFIPSGTIYPATFCISGASIYTIKVKYYFSVNGKRDSCVFNYTFDCPTVQDSLCDQSICTSGNRSWQNIASGVSFVYDMVVYQCKLIVAGQFAQAGNVAANNIAAWDGHNWLPLLQGLNGEVRALAVHNGKLYVGGKFTSAGLLSNVNNIASWDGSNWASLDNGLTGTGLVFVSALLSTPNGLVAGGQFQNAGQTSALQTNNIAQWNGTSWNANFNTINQVFNGPVYSLRNYSNQLYAAGTFNSPALNSARWNGSSWISNAGGINLFNSLPYNGVAAQYEFGGNLIVGGHYRNADNVPLTQSISKWNGSNWTSMSGGDVPDTIEAVRDFIRYNNKLYAAGEFSKIGNTLANGVAEWDGINWFSTNHPNKIAWALAAFDSCGMLPCDLYSAGEGFVNRWKCITAIDQYSRDHLFKIVPNPASNRVRIYLTDLNKKETQFSIQDLLGRTIYRVETKLVEGFMDIDLDILEIPSGMYFIEAKRNNQRDVQSLIIAK